MILFQIKVLVEVFKDLFKEYFETTPARYFIKVTARLNFTR